MIDHAAGTQGQARLLGVMSGPTDPAPGLGVWVGLVLQPHLVIV
jgi:hypothetical protein